MHVGGNLATRFEDAKSSALSGTEAESPFFDPSPCMQLNTGHHTLRQSLIGPTIIGNLVWVRKESLDRKIGRGDSDYATGLHVTYPSAPSEDRSVRKW